MTGTTSPAGAAAPWTCSSCDWVGSRHSADSHLRANFNHSVSPRPEVKVHDCGTRINARSLWCHGCRQEVK